ncbi:MAG: response regulator, partial [Deltaproteobacteria bacterium]|nr:response regulator [Deltaproteobacteria bacterium]
AQNSSGDSKVQLLISVSDTGIGIADDKLDMVFDRFTQADASTTRQYGGTGLGLNISRLIVELMGGSVWVESEPGKGSCFYFTAGFDISLEKQQEKESVKPALAGLKALVIDDARQNRIVLLDYLQSWGVACREAESGDAGLGLLRQSAREGAPYDVVILDCRMPVMDGFMVADIIRKESGLTGAVLMMLSSDHRQGDVQRCRQSGVAAHMLKPVKKSSLKAALMKVLGAMDVDQKIFGSHNEPGSTDAVTPVSVLLVEDNEDNRQLINFYLSKTDHRVDIAENGKIAVDKVKANSYDLILMDIQMPVLDGIEATKQIRAWEKKYDALPLPIVALTAGAFKEDREKCFAAGCTAYLSKPVKKKELIDTIAGYSAQNAK